MKSVFILFLIISFSCFSQNTIEKRKAFVLEIAANETQQYKTEIAESYFFVKDKTLQIYCGEKVFVECEIINDSIAKMKVVEKNLNPKKTIEIDFTQDSKNRKEISTMLEVKNPFGKDLIYEAIMLTPGNKKWKATSIIPVRANLVSYETWPQAIVSLVLINWKLKEF